MSEVTTNRRSLLLGESVLPLALVGLSLYWIFEAFRLKIWNGIQPGSGLMPLIYGSLLLAFAVAVLVFLIRQGPEALAEPVRKPLILVGLLIITLIGFPLVGAIASLFVMMSVMFILLERLSTTRSLLVAATVCVVFHFGFDRWLSVSLPHGPWGF